LIAVTSTRRQFVAGVHQYTNSSLLLPCAATCSTPPASQLTVRPFTAPPAIDDTFNACQSCAGDHQKTDRVPSR